MNRATKAVMTAAALPFVALPLTLGNVVPTAAAAGLIPDGPATVLHHGPTPSNMPDTLGGVLCEAPKVCREVHYDWIQPLGLIEIGVQENVRALDSAIKKVGTGPKIVYAFSGGARDASVWILDRADNANAPDPEDLSFVLIGNGGRKYGGVNGWWYGDLLSTPTDTQYEIVDIAREYDPIADFPHNPFNLLALANSIAAFQYVHLRYDEVDLDDPDDIVWKEGKTTYAFIPTEHLPLLQGFYDFGLGSLVENIEPALRAKIDKAYNRTWLEGKEPQGQASALSSADEVSRGALRSLRATDGDEAEGGDESVGASDGKNTSGAGGGATGDTDEAPPAGAAGGQAGEDGDAAGGATAHHGRIGGKHRAPLNGTRKIWGTKKAEATETAVSGGVDAGADSAKSGSSATSPSGSDSVS